MSREKGLTDQELLSEYACRGDEGAFAVVMMRYRNNVFNASLRVLGNAMDAEDIAQTVFVEMGLKAKELSTRAHLWRWLVRVAILKSKQVRRSRTSRLAREFRAVQECEQTKYADFEAIEERELILRVLDEELHELPSRYRDAIYSFYMDDRSVQEIAEATGQSNKSIHNCLSRGRKKLGERIKRRLGVTPAAVIGVLENLPEAPPLPEGFIEETTRAAMQIRQGLTPTGLNPNVTQLLAAKASWPLAKIMTGVGALLICAAVAVTYVMMGDGEAEPGRERAPQASVAKATAPSEFAPETPVTSGMVLIPGGTNAGTDPDTKKSYSLTVESFLMDRCEVTKALWDEVAAWGRVHGYLCPGPEKITSPSKVNGGPGPVNYRPGPDPGQGKAADHPVHSVNWHDCVLWCNARSEKDGFTPVYYADNACTVVMRALKGLRSFVKVRADGYRLPTLDEWQYAARGGEPSHRFPWHDAGTIDHTRANYSSCVGDVWDTSPTRGYHPTYAVEPKPYTSPVGAFPPNAYGLYDMAGNVSEWFADEAGRLERKYSTGSWLNGPRFGCWANRSSSTRASDVGFRTVRTPHSVAPHQSGTSP